MVAQGSIALLTERLISPREGPTLVARGGSPGNVGDRAVLRPGGAGVSGLAALTPAPPGRVFLAHPVFPGLPPILSNTSLRRPIPDFEEVIGRLTDLFRLPLAPLRGEGAGG